MLGLTLRLRAFDLRPFPILLVATIADEAGGPSAAHSGVGCSWSPEHAAIRALTEAAQARVGDFLAAREDLCRHDAKSIPPYGIRRTFGVPSRRWFYDAPAPARALDSFVDRSTDDIARDVERLAAALREANAGPVAVVDLSPGGIPLHVIRAVAPRLESPASGGRFGPTVRGILDLVTPRALKESDMTNADIERVSRSWIGHLATNPHVREKLLKARSDAEMASLINETVIPKENVEAKDVPAIAGHVKVMLVEGKEPNPLHDFQILNVVFPGSGGP